MPRHTLRVIRFANTMCLCLDRPAKISCCCIAFRIPPRPSAPLVQYQTTRAERSREAPTGTTWLAAPRPCATARWRAVRVWAGRFGSICCRWPQAGSSENSGSYSSAECAPPGCIASLKGCVADTGERDGAAQPVTRCRVVPKFGAEREGGVTGQGRSRRPRRATPQVTL
jgi:hypothetical protein